MEDPREISDAADDEGMAEDNVKYPEIDIEIEGLYVRGLVDTASPITCLSEEFFLANNKSFQACPKLPVIGHIIKGAIGTKSAKLKTQILAETWIGPEKRKIVYLIIPKLVRDCILGIEALKEYQFIINTPEDKLIMRRIDGDLHLNYSGESCKVERMREVKVLTIEEESLESKEDTETWIADKEQAPKYDKWGLFESISEISEVNSSVIFNALRNILQKYRAVFYKKSGRIHQFEYELQVQDKTPFFVKPYPIPINHRVRVRKEIQKMLD